MPPAKVLVLSTTAQARISVNNWSEFYFKLSFDLLVRWYFYRLESNLNICSASSSKNVTKLQMSNLTDFNIETLGQDLAVDFGREAERDEGDWGHEGLRRGTARKNADRRKFDNLQRTLVKLYWAFFCISYVNWIVANSVLFVAQDQFQWSKTTFLKRL